jgi:hypothetical protein
MIRKGTAPSVDYGIKPSDDGRFVLYQKGRDSMATLALVALTTVSVQATPLPSAKTRWRRHAGPDGCSRVDLSGKSELFRHRQGACDNPELSRRVTPVVCRRYCTALAVFSRIIAIRPRS